MPFAVWITGLPGSGKSTIAKALIKKISNTDYLRLDEVRKRYIKEPKFTDEERDAVYARYIEDGERSYKAGKNVVFDATAHKKEWREKARSNMANFMEVYIKCPVEVCMEREGSREGGLVQADLYRKAMERKNTGKKFEGLGKVAGVDVPYEENTGAELTIDSYSIRPEEAAEKIFQEIKRKGWA